VDGFIFSPLLFVEQTGRTYSGLMHVSDWFPTILALANITDYVPSKGHELSGHDQSAAILRGDTVLNTRKHLLYNTYHNVEGMFFDMHVNGSFAVRNERYKLMHAWDGPEAQWFDENQAMPNDDQLNRSASCFPIDTTDSTFTFFLFDLLEDPYERENLYLNSTFDAVKVNAFLAVWCVLN
jgi:arylsulfatase A-like enzyme